jgi:hypothetical protein
LLEEATEGKPKVDTTKRGERSAYPAMSCSRRRRPWDSLLVEAAGAARFGGPGGVGTCGGAPDEEEPAGDTDPRRERSALCLLSPGRFEFGGVLVDVVMLVGAERAVIEDAGEVGPDVVVAVVVG